MHISSQAPRAGVRVLGGDSSYASSSQPSHHRSKTPKTYAYCSFLSFDLVYSHPLILSNLSAFFGSFVIMTLHNLFRFFPCANINAEVF